MTVNIFKTILKKILENIISLLAIFVIFAGLSGVNIAAFAAEPTPSHDSSPYWYYVDSEKVYLPISTSEVSIIYEENLNTIEKGLASQDIQNMPPVTAIENVPNPEVSILELKPEPDQIELASLLDDLQKQPGVKKANPVFEFPDAKITITDQFVAQFKPVVHFEEIVAFNNTNNVEIIGEIDLPSTYILRVASASSALDMANFYHESDLTVYATPDFVRFLEKQFSPNDTRYPNQWAMENTGSNVPNSTGSPDADIDASSAWNISLGNAGTVIAIVDEGVELNHEDLNGKIVNHYSAVSGDSSGNPNNTWDGHGTACAGIAAAETNNSQGVAGVCPNCSLMPVQIAYSATNGGNWITSDSWIVTAITWAVNNGADVLSFSWGGGTSSSAINSAITNAVTNGRGGLGSVIVAASGNSNANPVIYPASNNSTIAVGATSPCDDRKDPTSCDGEGWGSNFGTALDVVAPGVKWWTTDMMGSAGYNTSSGSSGNYLSNMNGTSSATPTVAGLAGLIISHRPCLTNAQVRAIIQQSADDQVGYFSEDTNGWDQYMGWGRINAHQALLLANNYSCGDQNLSHFFPLILK